MLMNYFSFSSLLGANHGFWQQVICCQSACQQLAYECITLKGDLNLCTVILIYNKTEGLSCVLHHPLVYTKDVSFALLKRI